jgi:membrane protein
VKQVVINLWHLLTAVFDRADRANLGLIAAGVAFFGMFAIFPAIAALIAVFGLVADPRIVEDQLVLMREIIPVEAYVLFETQIASLLSTRPDTLGWATALSTFLALWSARAGVAALMQGLNAIGGGRNRGGLRHYAVALLLTICLMGIAVVALLVVVIAPIVLAFLPLPGIAGWVLEVLRWVVALFIVLSALGLLYRFGPNPRGPRMGWVTPGAFLVVVFWILASVGLSTYLTNFGSYNEVYGSIGAVVAMLLWLYISAYLVLMGAVLNATLAGHAWGDVSA